MRLTFCGTGAAGGTPVAGCECGVCIAARGNPALRRTHCRARIEVSGAVFWIDAGARCGPVDPDGILLTHDHADHAQGLNDLRWGRSPRIPVYAAAHTALDALSGHHGRLDIVRTSPFQSIPGVPVTPVALTHSRPAQGFVIDCGGRRVAWLTDTQGLPADTVAYFEQHPVDIACIDCSRAPEESAGQHNDVAEALAVRAQSGASTTYLIHVGHGAEQWIAERGLPRGVHLAYDGLALELC